MKHGPASQVSLAQKEKMELQRSALENTFLLSLYFLMRNFLFFQETGDVFMR